MRRRHRLLVALMPERVGRAIQFLVEAEEAHSSPPVRAIPSIAQEALIAAMVPETGKIWNTARYSVRAALLVELSAEGRLEVTGTGKKTRISVRDAAPLGVRELDDAMLTIGAGFFGSKATRYVNAVPSSHELLRRLVEGGLVVEEVGTRLGMFTVRRYRPTPAAGREEIVARISAALLGEAIPDERTTLLVASLVDVPTKLFVPKKRVREAQRRLPELEERLGAAERALLSAVHHVQTSSGGGDFGGGGGDGGGGGGD